MTSNETPMNSESPEECSNCGETAYERCCGDAYCFSCLEEHDRDIMIEDDERAD